MRVLILAACLTLTAGAAASQSDRLTVGVIERPPYATRTDGGAWLGLAIDTWRIAAEQNGWQYGYAGIDEGAAREALLSGAVDVVLPIDATPAREFALDLTHPIHTATMGIASPRQGSVASVIDGFLSWAFLRLVLGLSALLLVVGAVIWLLERRRNDGQFANSKLKGLGDGFWWAGVTLTTIGYGDKAPVTLAGRAVAMLWMLIGLAVSASLTAAIVALVDIGGAKIPEDLAGHRVGAVEGSTTYRFLANQGLSPSSYPDLSAALDALNEGDLDRVAAPAPVLREAVRGLTLSVGATDRDPIHIGMALPPDSDLLEALNASLLALTSSEAGWNLRGRYLQP